MAVAIFVGIAVVAAVLFLAAVAVLRESARMDARPPTRPFDKEEALAFVVQHVPDDVGSVLTIDDASRIIDLQLEYFARRGVSGNGDTGTGSTGDVVVGGSETVQFILRRAAEEGVTYTAHQVHAVVETQLAYLRSIGVVGPRVEGDEPEEPGPPGGG